MFAALDFAHVGAFDTREVRERFLGNTLVGSVLAHCGPKGECRRGFECR
jgi:hypothetical protein